MSAADPRHLPPSVGGLVGFACSSFFERAPLYVLLALGAFAAETIAEYALPAVAQETPQGQFKVYVLLFVQVFADALVIAAVALGVAARAAGSDADAGTVAGAAIERWLPVIGVSAMVALFVDATMELSGFRPTALPRGVVLVTAPLTWLLWGTLSLAPPIVALTHDRLAVITGFARAFTLSLRRANLPRLAILSALCLLPNVLQIVAINVLSQHHVVRWFFWGNFPIDALTIGPLAAVQTAFVLDFARRAGELETPPP